MNYPKLRRRKVRLFDFSKGLDASRSPNLYPEGAATCFNFRYSDGALKDGEGIKKFSVLGDPPTFNGIEPEKVYYYKRYDYINECDDDRIIIYGDNKKMYVKSAFDDEDYSVISGLQFDLPPQGVCYKLNGEDVMLFSSGQRVYVYDGSTVSDHAAPEITSMLVYNERLFVTTGGESTTLWFSENFDPTNFYVSSEEAGFIDFQDGKGKLLKIVESDGYAYVFRSYGITRVYAPFDQSEFTAANVEADNVRIIGNSIVDCGRKTIYLTDNGFYSFAAGYPTRILKELDNMLKGCDNEKIVAEFFNGRYYAKLNLKVDKKPYVVTLSYDVSSGEFYLIKGFEPIDMLSVQGSDENYMLVLIKGGNVIYKRVDEAVFDDKRLTKTFQTPFTDFYRQERKTLAKISLLSATDAVIKVFSDEGEKSVRLFGGKGVKTQTVGLKGVNFSVMIESVMPAADISNVTLEFTEIV